MKMEGETSGKTKKPVSKKELWDEHHKLNTRGTTQIVPLLRNTTSDSSKPYSLTQNHGNAYWNISAFRLRRDTQHCISPAHTYRRLSVDIGYTLLVFLTAYVRIIPHKNTFVKTFFNISGYDFSKAPFASGKVDCQAGACYNRSARHILMSSRHW